MLVLLLGLAACGGGADPHREVLCEDKRDDCVRLGLGLELTDQVPAAADQPARLREICYCAERQCLGGSMATCEWYEDHDYTDLLELQP